jgi:hypothetical protein
MLMKSREALPQAHVLLTKTREALPAAVPAGPLCLEGFPLD